MAMDDYLDSEVAVAVAATAAVLSPPVRRIVRRGAVYGLAGAMMAGDAVSSFARGAARGVKDAAESASEAVHGTGIDETTGADGKA